jgi:hypothetical protein
MKVMDYLVIAKETTCFFIRKNKTAESLREVQLFPNLAIKLSNIVLKELKLFSPPYFKRPLGTLCLFSPSVSNNSPSPYAQIGMNRNCDTIPMVGPTGLFKTLSTSFRSISRPMKKRAMTRMRVNPMLMPMFI